MADAQPRVQGIDGDALACAAAVQRPIPAKPRIHSREDMQAPQLRYACSHPRLPLPATDYLALQAEE